MLKHLVELLSDRTGDHGFLVIGGTPEMVKQASDAVPKSLEGRILEKPSLHLGMSHAEVKEASEQAASELTRRMQDALADQVVNQARAGGRACLGREETERALREMRVDTLLISRGFREGHPDFADRCVGTALSQDANIEELSGDGAERLDDEAGGIGARLRFKIRDGEGPDESAA